ncbi:helix-turn-helix domain-containing protein [Faecalicoccus pleomorphus]|uniref:helix-turn-helix domain-containing protein n=2 Tax=Faecalicoccus pleomorphus TaxID=1323 RepID=UPI00189C4CCD|nr:helix-turn-helix transcriptional regulator [Faecalicoccus pleomorphus]
MRLETVVNTKVKKNSLTIMFELCYNKSMENIGNLIKKYRQEKKMSIPQLAKKIDIDKSYLYRYEKNEMKPKYEMIVRIAQALEIPFNCLISDVYVPNTDSLEDTDFDARAEYVEKINNFKKELFFELWNNQESLSDKEIDKFYDFILDIMKSYRPNTKLESIIDTLSSKVISEDDLIKISDYARNELGITEAPKNFDDI